MERIKAISPEGKLKAVSYGKGPLKAFLIIQYGIGFVFSLSIAIASGIYLFNIEADNVCFSYNSPLGGEQMNVSQRFNSALIMYFTIGIVDTI